jgi:hypothetical protein
LLPLAVILIFTLQNVNGTLEYIKLQFYVLFGQDVTQMNVFETQSSEKRMCDEDNSERNVDKTA